MKLDIKNREQCEKTNVFIQNEGNAMDKITLKNQET